MYLDITGRRLRFRAVAVPTSTDFRGVADVFELQPVPRHSM